MERCILKLNISSEADVVIAYRKAAELSQLAGLETNSSHNFAIAVSDVCRNVLKHIGAARTEFLVAVDPEKSYLEAYITDNHRNQPAELAPFISTTFDAGTNLVATSTDKQVTHNTKVWLRAMLPEHSSHIANTDIKEWRKQLSQQYNNSHALGKGKAQPKIKELLDYLQLLNNGVISNVEENQHFIKGIERAHQQVLHLLQNYEEQYYQLKLINQHLDTFAYSVSHDLKAPLRNLEGLINGFRESLEDGNMDDVKRWLNMLQEQVTRMDEFIASVLASARNKSPEKQMKLVQPSNLIDQVLRTLNVPEGFKVNVQKRMREVYTSPVKLSQVFSNLICNAYKHHHAQKGEIRISARFNKQRAAVTFKVSDDGPGIPRERQKEIFKPFKTSETDQTTDNTGLGLFIVKQIVEETGGEIWVKSEGKGTIFYFTWPVGQPNVNSGNGIASRARRSKLRPV